MGMSYIIDHTRFGFCWWAIPVLIILAAVLALFFIKRREMSKSEKDLEDQLSALYADAAMRAEEAEGAELSETLETSEAAEKEVKTSTAQKGES